MTTLWQRQYESAGASVFWHFEFNHYGSVYPLNTKQNAVHILMRFEGK